MLSRLRLPGCRAAWPLIEPRGLGGPRVERLRLFDRACLMRGACYARREYSRAPAIR